MRKTWNFTFGELQNRASENRRLGMLMTSFQDILGAYHLVKNSGISGSAVNGTRLVGSSHWKTPRKSRKSKKVGPFSRLEFPNGISRSILLVSRSLYQFQLHGRAPRRAGVYDQMDKWNNFLPIGNSTFAPTEISGFFSWMESAPHVIYTTLFSPLLTRSNRSFNRRVFTSTGGNFVLQKVP